MLIVQKMNGEFTIQFSVQLKDGVIVYASVYLTYNIS